MSPKGKGHRSDKHKKSSSSSQPQDEEIPIDPNLTDPSYAGYTQDYAQADPSESETPSETNEPSDLTLPTQATMHRGRSNLQQSTPTTSGSTRIPAPPLSRPITPRALLTKMPSMVRFSVSDWIRNVEELNRELDEQPGPSSTAAAQQDYQCEQCDGRTFPGRREYK